MSFVSRSSTLNVPFGGDFLAGFSLPQARHGFTARLRCLRLKPPATQVCETGLYYGPSLHCISWSFRESSLAAVIYSP